MLSNRLHFIYTRNKDCSLLCFACKNSPVWCLLSYNRQFQAIFINIRWVQSDRTFHVITIYYFILNTVYNTGNVKLHLTDNTGSVALSGMFIYNCYDFHTLRYPCFGISTVCHMTDADGGNVCPNFTQYGVQILFFFCAPYSNIRSIWFETHRPSK